MAWDEIDLDYQETGETVQVEPLPELVTDGGTQQTAVDHDVRSQCGFCDGISFRIYEKESEIVAMECDHCGEVFEV